ncbi:MAG: hypothetical protein J0G99_02390 [Alphaproteobacteria bacterium]|nr:hypothetical protein [Alphaproteobacteria bacterium]
MKWIEAGRLILAHQLDVKRRRGPVLGPRLAGMFARQMAGGTGFFDRICAEGG